MPTMPTRHITTFTRADLRASAPTGQTQSRGTVMQIEHPSHGLRWIRRADWVEAHPRTRKPKPSGASGAIRRRPARSDVPRGMALPPKPVISDDDAAEDPE
jgi:hypothetical protein